MTEHEIELLELRDLVDELREENRQLKELLRPVDNPFYGKLGLTPQLAALLNAFYKHGDMPNGRLDEVITLHARETRGMDYELVYERARVAVCKLRAALRPHGVTIELARGMGYRIDNANRAKLTTLLEAAA